jgi:hypothetical protein
MVLASWPGKRGDRERRGQGSQSIPSLFWMVPPQGSQCRSPGKSESLHAWSGGLSMVTAAKDVIPKSPSLTDHQLSDVAPAPAQHPWH